MDDLKWAAAREAYYHHVHIDGRGVNEPQWRGVRVVKFPSDLVLYAQAIQQNKPDWIVETGTAFGGSALFLADMLSLFGGTGKVLTIDVNKRHALDHPRIEPFLGSSTDPAVFDKVKCTVGKGRVMAVLDSDHRSRHVYRELRMYGSLVTLGQFMVVEDSYTKNEKPYGPHKAVEWFLKRTRRFKREPVEDQFIFAVSRAGWLRRV